MLGDTSFNAWIIAVPAAVLLAGLLFRTRWSFGVGVLSLLIIGAVLATTGVSGIVGKPPVVIILVEGEKQPIEYEVLLNQWNGSIYDRRSYSEVLSERVEAGVVPKCTAGQRVTLVFGHQKPDTAKLMVDYNTNPIWSYRRTPEEVPLEDWSFVLPPTPAYPVGPAGWGVRYYVLTAAWGENEAEYAFAVDVPGETVSPDRTPDSFFSLNLNDAQIDWIEVSPQMSLTTYVEDQEYIDKVVNLINAVQLRTATADEVTRLKTDNTDEVGINGSLYKRTVRIDFQRWKDNNGQVGSENIFSLLLTGGLVQIDGEYYVPTSPLTDDFIAILDGICRQGNANPQLRPPLTMDVVRVLARGEITPEDVVNTYAGQDITSGIHSFYSELPDGYAFMIGFVDIRAPLYIRLIDQKTDESMDVTSESIDEFLARRKE